MLFSRHARLFWVAALAPALAAVAALGQTTAVTPKLEVFQGLDEATARISRLKDRPFQKLWDQDGYYQCETLIFHDLETKAEVVSLSMELCTDIANIERRCAWSCNGQYISFIGNKVFWNHGNNQLWQRTWAGYNYIANADGSCRRKLWGHAGGKLGMFQDKFNNWDQRRGNVLYFAGGGDRTLWKVTLGEGEKGNTAEAIYHFPDTGAKSGFIIQDIGDEDLMLVEESGGRPMTEARPCYLFDLNRDPKDPKFVFTAQLKGEGHGGSYRIRRGKPTLLTGGYEDHSLGGFRLRFDPEKGLLPEEAAPEADKYAVRMAHLWYGPPDDRVAFSGQALGKGFGLWLWRPGQEPLRVAITNDGHPTWCGHDPDWFFYANGTGDVANTDRLLSRRLLAGKGDGSEVRVICTPWDRRRGANEGGYDAIPRPNQSPDATKCWFHSSMLMPENKYTGSFIAVFRRPYAPVDVTCKDGKLSWTPHKLSFESRGVMLYRKNDKGWEWVDGPLPGTSVAVAKDGTYMLTSLEWSGLESDESSPAITLPSGAKGAAVKDFNKEPPPAVTGFTAAAERDAKGQYRLKWDKSPAKNVRYFNLYFSPAGKPEAAQKFLIASPQANVIQYLDWTAPVEGGAHYALTAVDRQGNESAPVFAESDGSR